MSVLDERRAAAKSERERVTRSREQSKRSRDMWTLAASFPTLTRWATEQCNQGVEFDGDAVLAALKQSWVTSGSRFALLFIGDVWNCTGMRESYPKPLRTWSMLHAWGVWDGEHRAAALMWLERPWWP